ncbi:MAG TPA: hypothetical protein VEV42_07195 [Pyrinomonadaceae bacterium]|nr:hypothetical protein [Pyrinomonadaceae bacterium]
MDKIVLLIILNPKKIRVSWWWPSGCCVGAERRVESMYELRRSHIARAILDYLLEHPDAQDTLAGIAEWWLPEEKIKTRSVVVKEALDQLVAKSLVLERRGKDLQTHYRINTQRLEEIQKSRKGTQEAESSQKGTRSTKH